MDLCLDPVHRKRDQPDAVAKIKLFHGFHQSNIALLDDVVERQSITVIAACHIDNVSQVRQNQFSGGFQITFGLEPLKQFSFLFCT